MRWCQRVALLVMVWGCTVVAARGVEVVEPHIPARQFSLAQFGAVGDGKTLNTEAFGKAMAAVKEAGGGTLVVPEGVFLTGPFQVVNNMELKLEKGAVIKATERLADYGFPEALPATQAEVDALKVRPVSLITGSKLDTLVISGEGTIDGSGKVWWGHVNKPTYYVPGAVLLTRPRLVVITGCQNLVVRGITLTNSPSFHLVPTQCAHVLIENVHIVAPERAPNTDAIDPSGCSNVLIRKCTLDVGDDDVAVKAGSAGACSNIEVVDCTVLHGHGISIGSETFAGVKGMVVRNCTFEGTTPAIRIKSGIDRGGSVSDILYENITMKNVSIAIELNMVYDPANGPNGARPGVTTSMPHVKGVVLKNITVTGAKQAMKALGLAGAPLEDVRLENVKMEADTGMSVEEAKGMVMKGVEVTVKRGEVLTVKNAEVVRE